MKIYISGKITGYPDFMERFTEAEMRLLALDDSIEVINPAKINSYLPKSTTHEEYMAMSFTMLDVADAIYMLDNWRESCGASQEYGYALARGKVILYENRHE